MRRRGRLFKRRGRRSSRSVPFTLVIIVLVSLAVGMFYTPWDDVLGIRLHGVLRFVRRASIAVADVIGETLTVGAQRSAELVGQTLPTSVQADHAGPPQQQWRLQWRSFMFMITGYDMARAHTVLSGQLRGYDALVQARSERIHLAGSSSLGGGHSVPPGLIPPATPPPTTPPPTTPPPTTPPPTTPPPTTPPPTTPPPTTPPPTTPPPTTPPPTTPPPTTPPPTTPPPTTPPTIHDRVPAGDEGLLPALVDWGDQPVIAILHTHASEMYRTDVFSPRQPHEFHLFDTPNTGIIRVGDRLATALGTKYGIPSVHDVTLHNTPCHSCAYRESRKTVQSLLQRYPSLMVIIDLHRDGAEEVSMVTTVGNSTVAQIAAVVGRPGATDTARHPQWLQNQMFANDVMQQARTMFPGLTRPVLQLNGVYNQDLHPNFIIIEVGNYFDNERYALRTADLLADVLAHVLYDMRFNDGPKAGAAAGAPARYADFAVH